MVLFWILVAALIISILAMAGLWAAWAQPGRYRATPQDDRPLLRRARGDIDDGRER